MIDDTPYLGSCCACGTESNPVRNIMMLHVRAPVPATGWGCLACGLPNDGAVAVLCDACLESEADIRWACVGYPGENRRIPLNELTDPFDHDVAYHPELAEQN